MSHKKLILILVSTCIMGASIQASVFNRIKNLFTRASNFARANGYYTIDACGYPHYRPAKLSTLCAGAYDFTKTSIRNYQYRGPRLTTREVYRIDACGYPEIQARVFLLRKEDTHNTPTRDLLDVTLFAKIGAGATAATAAYLYNKHKKTADTQSKK